jgi:hypothetical protein
MDVTDARIGSENQRGHGPMFIELTDRNDQPVFVNISLICWIRRSTDPRGGSILVFSAGSDDLRDSMLEVGEIPEVVCRHINIAGELHRSKTGTAPYVGVYRKDELRRGEETYGI